MGEKTYKDKPKIKMELQTNDSNTNHNVGNVPNFDDLVSGGIESGLQITPETDGEIISQPSFFLTSRSAGTSHIVQQSTQDVLVKDFVENLDGNESAKTIFGLKEENTEVQNVNKTSHLENGTRLIYRSVSENTTQIFSLTDDCMVKSGVSEQYFNNLVKELIITKSLLNELLQNRNIKLTDAVTWKQNKDQQTQIRHLVTENERMKTECDHLQSKLEEVHSELCMFKSYLRKEKEGETIHPTTTEPKTLGFRSNSREVESMNSEVNSSTGFKVLSGGGGSTVKSDVSSISSVNKSGQTGDSKELSDQPSLEEQNKENHRLQHELNQMKKCLDLAMNECEVTESYTQLLTTCDELRKTKDDDVRKLEQENIDLQKTLKNLKEDNWDYMSHYDKLFHEKIQLQQQICEQKSLPSRPRSNLQTLSTASPTSLSVSSLQSAKMDYFDTQRKQAKESVNIPHDPTQEQLRCDRCYSEFDDEMEFLLHVQNCLP
ncbi:hypothetical protein KUTeg_003103 [Tegillarca granosa]|uniref:Uncharacterized protein n=1 Tax=Tegillarca granosa TaxID=220873 RepID=A0ABQ9FQ05_TEGGR|nr:hypothetical protein KUTeg_003103 [Tegillarca granosa]